MMLVMRWMKYLSKSTKFSTLGEPTPSSLSIHQFNPQSIQSLINSIVKTQSSQPVLNLPYSTYPIQSNQLTIGELNLASLPDMAQWNTKPPYTLADLEQFRKAHKENLENQSLFQAKLNDEGDPE
jgi:hypothetical protein